MREQSIDYILGNKQLLDVIENSLSLCDARKLAEEYQLLNDVSVGIFFYQEEEKVLSELLKNGIQLGVKKINEEKINKKQENIDSEKSRKELNKNFFNQENIFNNFKYRDSNIKSDWKESENWMDFFIQLGNYIFNKEEVSVYISYVNEIIPAMFVLLGIVESSISNLRLHENHLEKIILDSLSVGDYVVVRENSKEDNWYPAIIKNIENSHKKSNFNPIITTDILEDKNKNKKSKSKFISFSIPKPFLVHRVRMNANVKKTAGNKVLLDDRLSEYLEDNYSNQIVNALKMMNRDYVNVFGIGVEKSLIELRKQIEFSDGANIFNSNDLLFFLSDGYNYKNVNFINSLESEPKYFEEAISIFVGDNSGNRFARYKAKRNVYLTNRLKMNQDSNEMLVQRLEKENIGQNTDEMTEELLIYFKKQGVNIPRGVELYVFK